MASERERTRSALMAYFVVASGNQRHAEAYTSGVLNILDTLAATPTPPPAQFGYSSNQPMNEDVVAQSSAVAPPEEPPSNDAQAYVLARLLDEFEEIYGTDGNIGLIEVRRWIETRHVHWPHTKWAAPRSRRLAQGQERPRIICLCGSTRFIETFAVKTWELEREGFIVLGCTLLPMWYCQTPSHFGEKTGTKEQCDALHLKKIDLADEVLVLNVDGYIGESTRNEIAYAERTGKPVKYLEPPPAAAGGRE